MKRIIRKIIPFTVRRAVKILHRQATDYQSGLLDHLAQKKERYTNGFKIATITQPIFASSGSVEKIHNLQIAINYFAEILIAPKEVFSFWHIIGSPSAKQGFQKGRNIIGGKLQTGYGGGLCQISGLIYHLCLLGRLEILERHAHSLDLYTEENRYAPLGSDATVVYGYKDLRIQNPFDGSFWFSFTLSNTEIKASLHCSSQSHVPAIVKFRRDPVNLQIVRTMQVFEGKEKELVCDCYPIV